MVNMSKKVDIDFKMMFSNVKDYFTNLGQYQQYSWMAIGLGIVLIIVSFAI